jgi:hypothetical protein
MAEELNKNLDQNTNSSSSNNMGQIPITQASGAIPNTPNPPRAGGVGFLDSDLKMPNIETVQTLASDLVDTSMIGPVDPVFKDLIDKTSVDLNKYSGFIPPNNNIDNPLPGKATSQFNPVEENANLFDLSTSEGRENSMNAMLEKSIGNKDINPSPTAMPDIHFSEAVFNFDRFYSHPRYADLGFNLFADNESLYAASSNKWDNFTRTHQAFLSNFMPAFNANWRSVRDFFGNKGFESDFIGAKAMMDAQRIGHSPSGGFRGWANDLYLNSAYTLGIISSVAVEELAMWGAAVLAAPATGTGSLWVKGADTLRKGVTVWDRMKTVFDVRKYIEAGTSLMKTLENIDDAKSFYKMVGAGLYGSGRTLGRFLAPETAYAYRKLSTAAARGDNISNLAKASTYFGGFYRDLRSLNMALSESKMEAGIVELELRDELYTKKKNAVGRELTEEEKLLIAADAKQGGFKTLLMNAPIIWITNKLTLHGAIRGFRPVGELVDALDSGIHGRIRRNTLSAKNYAKRKAAGENIEAVYDAGEYMFFNNLRKAIKSGTKGTAKHMAASAIMYSTANLAEGFQETFQEATSFGVKKFYEDIYDSAMMSEMEVQMAGIEDSYEAGRKAQTERNLGDQFRGLIQSSDVFGKYAKAGLESQMSHEGFKVFMSGFAMGGLIQMPQNLMFKTMPSILEYARDPAQWAKNQEAKDKYIKAVVDAINKKYNDPANFFDEVRIQAALQNILNKKMFSNTYAHNVRELLNDQDYLIFSSLKYSLDNGFMPLFTQQLKDFKNLDDADLKIAFGENRANAGKLRERLDGMIYRSQEMEKDYADISLIVNPHNRKKYDPNKDPINYRREVYAELGYEMAKDFMMFSKDGFRQALTRANNIMKSFSEDPVLSKMEASDIRSLTSKNLLEKEIEILEAEIAVPGDTKQNIEDRNKLKKKLDLLKEFKTILYDPNNRGKKDGFLRKNLGKLRPVFIKYLENIANKGNVKRYIKHENIDKVLVDIIDHDYLNNKAEIFNQAIDHLVNPNNMFELGERMSDVYRKTYESHANKNAIYLRVKSTVDRKERRLWLQALAAKGIVPDEVETKEFFETGKLPETYYTEDTIITEDNPLTVDLWEDIEALSEGLKMEYNKTKATTGEDVIRDDDAKKDVFDFTETDKLYIPPKEEGKRLTPGEESQLEQVARREEFYETHIPTQNLMKKIWKEDYKANHNPEADGPFLEYKFWKLTKAPNGKGGLGILNARYELYQEYDKQDQNIKDKKDFENWIISQNNKLKVSKILDKNGVSIYEVSTIKNEDKGIERLKGKISKTLNVPLTTKYEGIFILETITKKATKKGEKDEKFYEVVDENNTNLYDKAKFLDKTGEIIKDDYLTLKEAEEAAKIINKNIPIVPFVINLPFGKKGKSIKFETGDIIIKGGKQFLNRTSKLTYENKKGLYLVPLEKATELNFRKAKPVYINKASQWQKGGYKLETEIEDAPLAETAIGQKKLPMTDPVVFYGFDPGRVQFGEFKVSRSVQGDPEEIREKFEKWLADLTPSKKEKLVLLVERNPMYDKDKLDDIENLDAYDKDNKLEGDENPGLKAGQNEFEITLLDGRVPVAKLRNSGLVILTDGKNVIDGTQITQEQAEKLFNVGSNPHANLEIQNRYRSLDILNKQLRKTLGNKPSVRIRLNNLKDVSLKTTDGYVLYKEDDGKTQATSTYVGKDKLQYQTYDGHTVIVDISQTWKDGMPVPNPRLITDADVSDEIRITSEIINAIRNSKRDANAGLENIGLGRYVQFVKSPSGVITWFKIRPEKLSNAKISKVLENIKEQITVTEKKNFITNKRGASVLKTTKQGLDININDDFNDKLQSEGDNAFYIEDQPGVLITMGLNKQAQLIINYYDKFNAKEGRMIRANAYIDSFDLKTVNTPAEFIELINNTWKEEQLRIEKQIKAEGKRYTKVNLKITEDNFVNHIPRDASIKDLETSVVPQIQSKLRDRQKAYISVDNAVLKAAYGNKDIINESEVETSGGTMTQTTPYGTKHGEGVSLPSATIKLTDEKMDAYINDTLPVEEAAQIEEQIISQHKEGIVFEEGSNESFLWNSRLKEEFEKTTEQNKTNDNITYVKLENEYKAKRKEKRKEFRARFNKEYPNYTAAQRTFLINSELKKDVDLNDYLNRLEEIRKKTGLAKKVIRGGRKELDGLDIANIDDFTTYVESIAGDVITVENIKTLKDNMIDSNFTPGLFAMNLVSISDNLEFRGKIYTSPEAPYKYHEAFHGVFRMFLTKEEQQKILRQSVVEMKKDFKDKGISLNKELKEFKESSPLYEGINDRNELLALRAEEWLADQFEIFKNNKVKSKASSEAKSIFTKIIEFIKSLFEKFTKSDIQLLFDRVDRGAYRNAKPIESNMFTESVEFGAPQIALKLIRSGRTILERPVLQNNGTIRNESFDVVTYLPANIQKTLVSTISAFYINKVRNVKGQYNPDTLLDEAITDYVELYNPDDIFFKEMEEKNSERYDDIIDDLEERYDTLTDEENVKDIKAAVSEYLDFFDINISDKLEELNDPEFDIASNVRTTDQYDKASDQIGGWKSLSSAIRKFIATTTIVKEDEFGRVVHEPVDFVEAYNGLLKSVKNTKNAVSILQKMALFASRNEQTRAVVTSLFNEMGISETLEDVAKSTWSLPEVNGKPVVSNANFYQGVIKGFTQFRLDYLFAQIDSENNIVNIFPANTKDDANSQMDKWNNAYAFLYEMLVNNTKNDQGIPMHTYAKASWNDLFKWLKRDNIRNKDLERKSIEISANIKDSTGIDLNPGYIKYLIIDNITGTLTDEQAVYRNSFKLNEKVEREDIDEIIRALGNINPKTKKAEPILFDKITDTELTETGIGEVSNVSLGVRSRLHKLARGNANFDETIGTTVFRSPEGKLIYAHQMPSFHMEKVESLNSLEEIEKLKEDPYYKNNYLLNDPKFIDLAEKGLLRIVRIAGYKHVILKTTEEGDYIASKALDTKQPGIAFGNASARDIISLITNVYFSNYNPATGKVKKEILIGENNKVSQYVTSPIDIRVIEATSTGDLVGLPIDRTVVMDESNKPVITEEYIDAMLKEGQTGFEVIQREYSERIVKGKFVAGTIEGYNTEEKGKWSKLGKERELFIKREKSIVARKQIEAPKLSTTQKTNIIKNKSGLVLINKSDIKKGDVISASIKQGKQDLGNYIWENTGRFTARDFDLDYLLDQFGESVSKTKGSRKYTVKLDEGTYYTNDGAIARFLKGKDKNTKKPAAFDIIKVSPIEEAEIGIENLEPEVYTVDESIAVALEAAAKDINPETITEENPEGRLYTWDEVVDIIGKDVVRDAINDRLELFFSEFKTSVSDLNIEQLLNKAIGEELETSEGVINETTKKAMSDLYLEPNQFEHNLKQIFFNDYLKTKSFNQILLGNTSMTLKDAVDEIKRAKMQTAAGPSADSSITSPYEYNEFNQVVKGFGVDHLVDHISMVPFIDPQRKSGSEKTDGQIYMTMKAFKYMWFGFGLTSRAMDGLLRKIERGDPISLEEYFGNTGKGLKGYKQLGAILNSKKLVYGDGRTYLKMSAIVLTPELTSYKDENGLFKHIPGRKELHNLRLNLEKLENEPGAETLGIGVPISASKMLKDNVLTSDNVSRAGFDLKNNITDLHAEYMRLQQVNPSNKNEKVDPRQIKNLITSEQLDEAEINIAGVKFSMGYIRSIYNKNTSDRFLNKYFAKRNLIWNFKNAQNELQRSIDLKQATPDLTAFKDYALSALEASQSKAQMYDIFEGDYELNSPMTWRQYQRLFLSFFTKDVFQEKEAGHTISLVSDWGLKPMKEVLELDENGQPKRWRVVRLDEWMQNKPEVIEDYDDKVNKTFRRDRLKVGDIVADELKHNVMEYNEDGTPTGERYSEFMLPAHFAEMMNIKIGDPIPEVLAKMFAVRIPSQDKHSAVNLKLVGFLPVFYGSSGMFAEEMIANMGADFDIDKVYAQIKEWYYTKKDGFVEYGNGLIDPTTGKGINNKSEQTLFNEYKRWINDNARKKGSSINLAIRKWATKNNQPLEEWKIVKEAIDVEVEWNQWTFDTSLPSNITPKASRIRFAEEKGYPYNKETGEFKPVIKKVVIDEKMIKGGLREIGLPITKKEYLEYKENHGGREPYTAAQSNVVLDTKRMLQGNDWMMREDDDGSQTGIANEPAVIDPLVDVLNWMKNEIPEIAEELTEEGIDIDNLVGKLKAWANNHEGADNIGAVVLPNLVLNILSEYNIDIRNKEGIGQIELDGVTYDKFNTAYSETIEGKEQRTQFVISALITAMTDNAKERLAAYLGLNKDALAVVATMTGLGVPIKDSILLVNHPTIKQLYFLANDPSVEKGIQALLNDQIEFLESQYKDMAAVIQLESEHLKEQISIWKYREGSKKSRQKLTPEEKDQAQMLEYKSLVLFKNARNIKQYVGYVQNFLTISAGLGENTGKFDQRNEAFDALGMFMPDKEFNNSLIPFDVRGIFKGEAFETDSNNQGRTWNVVSFQSSIYKAYSELESLLPSVFVWQTETFNTLTNLVIKNLDPWKVNMQNEKIKYQGSILSFLTGKAYIKHLMKTGQAPKLASLQNGLIYDEFATGKMTIKHVMQKLKEIAPDNYFVNKYLFTRITNNRTNNSGINEVIANTWTKLSDAQIIEIQREIIDLYTDQDARTYIEHLVNYLLVKDGLQFAPNSFLQVLPIQLLDEINSAIKPVHNLFKDKAINNNNYKDVFGSTFEELVDEVTNSILKSTRNAFYLKQFKSKPINTGKLKTYKGETSIDELIKEKDTTLNKQTTIIQALEEGAVRGVATKNKLANKVGNIIIIGENDTQYKVKEITRITKFNAKKKGFIKKWTGITGYTEDYYNERFGNDDRIKIGSHLTVLEKVKKPKEIQAILNLDVAFWDPAKDEFHLTMFPRAGWSVKGRKGKKTRRKSSYNLKQKEFERKIKKLEKLGVEFVTVKRRIDGRMREILLMDVPKFRMIKIGKEYIALELDTVEVPDGYPELDSLYDFDNYPNGEILGMSAKYKRFDPEGSLSQFDGGGFAGPRSTKSFIVDMLEERSNQEFGKKFGEFDPSAAVDKFESIEKKIEVIDTSEDTRIGKALEKISEEDLILTQNGYIKKGSGEPVNVGYVSSSTKVENNQPSFNTDNMNLTVVEESESINKETQNFIDDIEGQFGDRQVALDKVKFVKYSDWGKNFTGPYPFGIVSREDKANLSKEEIDQKYGVWTSIFRPASTPRAPEVQPEELLVKGFADPPQNMGRPFNSEQEIKDYINNYYDIQIENIKVIGRVAETNLKKNASADPNQIDVATKGELIKFWNELSSEIKERLATSQNDGGYSVRTQEDFVSLYNQPNMQFDSLDEFKEYINNCLK